MSRTHAALIVDSDPNGLESLVYGFQSAGWRITACPVPETAALLVKASGADIVVAASRNDHDKAQLLVRQLRGKVPVLVLGPKDLRPTLKKEGDADLLALPAYVRDVVTASQLLAGMRAPAQPGSDEPCFVTATSPQDVLSLIRTMNGLGRSGALRLSRKGRHGEILFREGKATAAEVGQLQGVAAIQHVLVWDEGTLEVRLRSEVKRGQIHQSSQKLLEDLDRFQRDYAHVLKDIGPSSTVYLVSQERLVAAGGAVPAEVAPVVRLCDGQRGLADVIEESPFRVLDTIRTIVRLVELAVLTRRDPRAQAPAGRNALDAFWSTAQIVATGQAAAGDGLGSVTPTPSPVPAQASLPLAAGATAPFAPPPPATPPASPFAAQGPGPAAVGQAAPFALQAPPPLVAAPTSPFTLQPPPADPETVTPPPRRETPAPAGAEPRAQRQTLDLGAPVERKLTPPVGQPSHSPSQGVPVVRPMAPLSSQTSGAFELRRNTRASQHTVRLGEPRSSVVIDVGLVEAAAAQPAAATVSTQAPVVPAEPASVAQAPQATVVVPAPAAATRPPAGELPGSPVGEPAPARETPSQETAPAAVAEPAGARVTGELRVATSGRATRGPAKAVVSSFEIDPSLASATPIVAPRKPEPANHETAPAPEQQGPHRPSGSFSALESEFFEREADLYKVENAETFADLDDPHGKSESAAKPAPNGPKRR